MNTSQTVSTFVEFFRGRGHQEIDSSSLLPRPGDPVLYTTSGMHPLTPYLAGEPHSLGRRLTGVQRCLRTTDLEEVGDSSHLTVFQMLGSWSLGDYGGPQSLRWGLEMICDHFGLKPGLLYATAFGGDDLVGPDTEALSTWSQLGLPVELLGADDNWWSNGPTGPCGPDSEIFFWTGTGPPQGSPGTDSRWLELWNHVTMRYERHPDGSLSALAQPSVDTGMGLERLLMVSQGVSSVYESDLFAPWLAVLPGLWRPDERSLRIITDHLRSSIVIIGDGVRPSNTGRGYVLRRLLRRALTSLWDGESGRGEPGRGEPGRGAPGRGEPGRGEPGRGEPGRGEPGRGEPGRGGPGRGGPTLGDLPPELVLDTASRFGMSVEPSVVHEVLLAEERKFGELLTRGRSLLRRLYPAGELSEADYAFLHDTHGLPRELVSELAGELRAG